MALLYRRKTSALVSLSYPLILRSRESGVSKDEACEAATPGLMVRDGADAPPHHEGLELSHRCSRRKGIAGFQRTLLIAVHEPLLALRRRAVREGVRHHAARGLALQGVVADRRRGRQRRVDVAGLQEVRPLLRLAVDPDAGQAVGLQLHPHLQRIGFGLATRGLLLLRHARNDAEQVLNVMAGLMRDDVGRGELAGAAGAAVKA